MESRPQSGFRIDPHSQSRKQFGGPLALLRSVDKSRCRALAAKENVLPRRQARNKVELLIDDGNSFPLRIHRRADFQLPPVDADRAGIGQMSPANGPDQRALPGTVFSDQREDFARVQLQVHVLQGGDAGERFGDAAQVEERGGL